MFYLLSYSIYRVGRVGNVTKAGSFIFVYILVMLMLTGCDRIEVIKAEFHPKYICTGETATFEWDITNIDRIELSKSDGSVLKSTSSSSGTYTTPPINASMLPLKVTGYIDDNEMSKEVEFSLIDNPHWTMTYGTTLEESHNEEEVLVVIEPSDNIDGSTTNIRQYDIYRTFTGYTINIPHTDFSARARVRKISRVSSVIAHSYDGAEYDMNTWPGDLILERPGVENAILSRNASFTVPLLFHPGGTYKLKYPNPERRLVARMSWPEGTGKEGKVYRAVNDPYWNQRAAGLKFEVICD